MDESGSYEERYLVQVSEIDANKGSCAATTTTSVVKQPDATSALF